jgi:undecaprenyl-diphosphatase
MLPFLESLDVAGFRHINQAATNPIVAYAAHYVDTTNVGNVLLMAGFWYFWFAREQRRRPEVLASFIGIIAAILVCRLLAIALPFRIRPIYASDAGFMAPGLPAYLGLNSPGEDWSSFPSDTAALLFAQAYGLWRYSRIVGAAAFAYAIADALLARVALCIHYPGDTIVGAIIGCGSVALSCWLLTRPLTRLSQMFCTSARPLLYFLMFCVTSEITLSFGDVLQAMRATRYGLHRIGVHIGLFDTVLVLGGALLIVLSFLYVLFWLPRRNLRPEE